MKYWKKSFFFSVKGMRQKDNKNNTNCKKNKKIVSRESQDERISLNPHINLIW